VKLREPDAKSRGNLPGWTTAALSLLLFLVAWYLVTAISSLEKFILPSPVDVGRQLANLAADGRLWAHTWQTLSEIIMGLTLGCLVAIPLGYLLSKSPLAERLLSPYLIASQAIPVLAIAPLLTIWIRSTYWSRVLVAVLVVFFPVLVNSIAGMRSVPDELYALLRSLRANRWQTFRLLELPAALPAMLAGLKIGATLSVIGALVGEFVQPRSVGLGYLLLTARYQYRTDQVFAVLAVLAVIALSLYGLMSLAERRLLRWQVESRN